MILKGLRNSGGVGVEPPNSPSVRHCVYPLDKSVAGPQSRFGNPCNFPESNAQYYIRCPVTLLTAVPSRTVSGLLMITIQLSGAQILFDLPVYIINPLNAELNPMCP